MLFASLFNKAARLRRVLKAVDLTPPVTRLLMKVEAFRGCQRGVSAVEYALILGLLAAGITVAMSGIGGKVSRIMNGVTAVLNGSSNGTAGLCTSTTAVGTACQLLNHAGGTDSVVVAQVGNYAVWPTDEPAGLTWNDGSSTWAIVLNDPGNASADMSGMTETTALVGYGSSPSPAPYKAANACRAHGPDWYLPALGELLIIGAAAGQNGRVFHGNVECEQIRR